MKILSVCGFGVGSSMLLKMKIDEVFKKNNIKGSVETSDIGSVASVRCDCIFTSNELAKQIKTPSGVHVVSIRNFMDYNEIETKVLKIAFADEGRYHGSN